MQVQECIPHSVSPALGQQLVSPQALFRPSVRLHVPLLTDAARGIRWEHRRVALAERNHRHRSAELERCGRKASRRSNAAGDGIAGSTVITRLKAKVASARERRSRE